MTWSEECLDHPTMAMITVRLLGALDIRDTGGDELSTLLRQPKRIALLSYLAVAQPRGFHRRDTLMGLFWPASTQDQARNALSQALHVLRQELGDGAILTRGEGEVALSEDVVSVDVWDLDAAFAGGDYERVVELYRGPLLAGFSIKASAEFDQWLDTAGDRVAGVYSESLEHLAEAAAERGDRRQAVEWLQRLAQHHPYATRETLLLMRALEAAGDRAGALEQGERHAALLQSELSAEPSPDVVAYAEQLRRQPVRHVGDSSLGGSAAGAAQYLDSVRRALADRYAIEREIGSGGMATVFLAGDLKHERQVAVKVLRPELVASLGADRFLREIKITASLSHPHILPLLDSGRTGESSAVPPFGRSAELLYYVMPHVDGESLRDRLNREKQLSLEDALRITREVADALGYAHSQDVVHRDIKPENILLQSGHAVVADFGVARAIAEAGEDRITGAGTVVGTPAYMSPEQASGEEGLDGRSDLYSLGCVLYEMLAGEPPFTGPSAEHVIRKQQSAVATPVSVVRPGVSVELSSLVEKMLAKATVDRYQTAGDVAAALHVAGAAASRATTSGTLLRPIHPMAGAGLLGAGALAILGVTYLLMMQLGLPNWVLVTTASLLVVILPISIATALFERQRVVTVESTRSPKVHGVMSHWLRWRNAAMVTATAFIGLGLATSGYMGMKTLGTGPLSTVMARGALAEHDRILVADFENRTSDSLLGATLTDALRIDLRQSPVIRVLESQELRDALRRMGRDVTEPVTLDLAQELAEREGIKAVVAGEVGVLGEGYLLSGRLVGVATGEVLAAERVAARGNQELIHAVDDLSAKLRERIGESLKTVRGTPPLAQVTTSSLEALRLYTQADRVWRENQLDAIPYFEQAIALDTAFGMAYRRLIITLRNLQLDPVREGELARKAYAHRDRVTDRERYLIEADYYGRVEGDLGKVEATVRRMVERYPDDLIALNGLGNLLRSQRRWAEAENLQRRARDVAAGTLEGQWSPAYTSILPCQFALDDSAAIDTSIGMLETVRPADALRFAAEIAAARRDYDAAWNGFEQLAQQEPERGRNGLQLIAAVRGQLGLATELSRLVTAGCRQRNDHYCVIVEGSQLARMSAHYRGSTTDAIRLLDSVVNRYLDSVPASRRRQALWTAATSYAMLGKDSVAGSILAAYRIENPEEVIRMDFDRFEAVGWVGLASGQLERAKMAFRAWYDAYTYCTLCGLYELALTFDHAGSLDSALAYYEQALTTPEIDRLSWEWDWLPTTYRRLGELYELRGESNDAVYYYNQFVELWKDADPELQPQVEDVMRRIERLMGEVPL